jgi:Protein of unknown function (DUF3551)
MRCAIILAAGLTAMSATGAHAQQWCGYAARAKSIIQCGYSSVEGCESAIGKGGMCFINPDYALDSQRATPVFRHPEVPPPYPPPQAGKGREGASKGDGPAASAASFEARFARTSG